ncbi:MAG: hypothetical protein ACK41D_07310 [Rubricoccaceae bacterium]
MPTLLATPLPDDLAARSPDVVALLRSDAPRRERAEAAFEFIYDTGAESLRYHFREPLETLGVGFVTRKAVGAALDVALRGIRGALKNVLSGMDDAQLARVADEIERRLMTD